MNTHTETLQSIVQQNKQLIQITSMASFIILLLTGTITNTFLNMVYMMWLAKTSVDILNATKDFPQIMLHKWIVFAMITSTEYIFLSICNVLIINVVLNIVKIGLAITMSSSVSLIYDIYIEKWYDQLFTLINNMQKIDEVKPIDNKYDAIKYIKLNVAHVLERAGIVSPTKLS